MKKQELERELGRYKKRCDDLMKINRRLAEQVKGAAESAAAANLLIEAIQIQTALTYGESALDPDTGEELGKRLTLPHFDARELVRKYKAHTRRGAETGTYVIGVGLRDDPRDGE